MSGFIETVKWYGLSFQNYTFQNSSKWPFFAKDAIAGPLSAYTDLSGGALSPSVPPPRWWRCGAWGGCDRILKLEKPILG